MSNLDLHFKDFIDNELPELDKGEWVTVYDFTKSTSAKEQRKFYTFLVPVDNIKEFMEKFDWGNYPSDVFSYIFSDKAEVFPLIINRYFPGSNNRKDYLEVLERFRLRFNLYEDRKLKKFIVIDKVTGDEEDAILLKGDVVKVKLNLIKKFCADNNMRCVICFTINRRIKQNQKGTDLKSHGGLYKGENFIYDIDVVTNLFRDKIWSGIKGKKLISEYVPREKDENISQFITGIDENGEYIKQNYSDETNPVALTRFKKEVLKKYYDEPNKYTVGNGILKQNNGSWQLQIDNNHPTYVTVFLAYLGKIPNKERQHWVNFNVYDNKAGVSNYAHMLWLGKIKLGDPFPDPDDPMLYFKQQYDLFNEKWKKKYGWQFFKDFPKQDKYLLKSLHTPLTTEQKEFDDMVLAITKIFIDSLNEEELIKEIAKHLAPKDMEEIKDIKAIDKLEMFFGVHNLEHKNGIEFLRKLQGLRSTGSAHRKGDNYKKAKKYFSIRKDNTQTVFEKKIIIECIGLLNDIEKEFLKGVRVK